MKVLYFHQHFSTPNGSTGTRSYEMAKRLVRGGHHVTMVCGSYCGGNTGLVGDFRGGRREGEVDGIEVIEFNLEYSNATGFVKRVLLFMLFAFRSVNVAMTRQYDVLFATSTPLTAAIPGIFARWLRRKPFVFEVRDLWPELPKAMGVIKSPLMLWAMGILEWAAYHSAHKIVALAPGMVQGIVGRGIHQDRIAMIPNGCDFDIFGSSDRPWRPEGVAEADLLAIFTGTHGMANGLHAVIDAAEELQKRGRFDIKIAFVGDGKLKPELMRRAESSCLSNVSFHDPVGKTRLAGLMAAADIGLQILDNIPAFYDGTSPNKFFDYISAGLPVLNNYPGWLGEKLENSKCGITVKPGDAAEFADALEWAESNRCLLETMSLNARNLAKEEFDRELLGGKFVKVLEAAIGK